ncbi:MAG: SurA N-terminal domain-containing protein [Bacteroidota bacterium]
MAVIGRIRKRSGIIIVIVGVALASFVLGDFIKKGPKKTTTFAKIAGDKVSYQDFEAKVLEQEETYKQQSGKENLTNDEAFQIKQQAWGQMVREIILTKQLDELGLTVSTDELDDLIRGKNPHPYVSQAFKDPETGQFNPTAVTNFLNNIDKVEPAMKKNYLNLEKAIKNDRLNTKYTNLISKSYYLPTAFAKRMYNESSTVAKLRLVALNYKTIDDKLAVVTDDDLKKYYEGHKNQYEQQPSRDLEYVVFEVLPSKTDLEQIQKEVATTFTEFEQATDIANFVNSNSDSRYDSSFIKLGVYPAQLDSFLTSKPIGSILPPFTSNNNYYMAKLLDIQARPDSLKATHILISYKEAKNADPQQARTKESAKIKADSIYAVVKKDPTQFAKFVSQSTDDPSAKKNKGDLGWFTDGSMVKPFNDAVLEGKVGDITLVETDFGYHIIYITGKTNPIKKYKVAVVTKAIAASKETDQAIFVKANKFASDNKTAEAFNKAVVAQGLNKRQGEYIQPMDKSLPGLTAGREIIHWAYNENTTKEMVSSVFNIDNNYIVAYVKEIREKGIASFEQAKTYMEPMVKREKKGEMLVQKFNTNLSKTKDLYQLATNLSSKVDTTDLTFSAYNLAQYGPEPKVVGRVFSLAKGTLSAPIAGDNGAYVVMVDSISLPQPTKDYKMIRMQAANMFQSRVSNQIFQVLEKKADIEDNRYMFY